MIKRILKVRIKFFLYFDCNGNNLKLRISFYPINLYLKNNILFFSNGYSWDASYMRKNPTFLINDLILVLHFFSCFFFSFFSRFIPEFYLWGFLSYFSAFSFFFILFYFFAFGLWNQFLRALLQSSHVHFSYSPLDLFPFSFSRIRGGWSKR